jgi:hypothetical protein
MGTYNRHNRDISTHPGATSTSSQLQRAMGSVTDEAALAKIYRPDTGINLSLQDNTAVYISDGIQQYITGQLGLVSPLNRMITFS